MTQNKRRWQKAQRVRSEDELHRLILTALVARSGGEVLLTPEELKAAIGQPTTLHGSKAGYLLSIQTADVAL